MFFWASIKLYSLNYVNIFQNLEGFFKNRNNCNFIYYFLAGEKLQK